MTLAVCQKVKQHRERMAALKDRYTFDADAAARAADFFPTYLRHWKEPHTGKPFNLAPWQREDIIEPLFGLMDDDGRRLFREAYIQLGRKNGKSALAAGILLLILFRDGGGLELYTAATRRDQAKIVFADCTNFIRASPKLKRNTAILKTGIEYGKTSSKLEPLSSDYNGLDGLNVSAAVIDELHAHKTPELHDVIMTATGARAQPLVLKITTAGAGSTGICRDQYEYAEKVLAGDVVDDRYFAYIAEADKNLAWDSAAAFEQANPNLGVSISVEYLEREREKARATPTYRRSYERYHLNRWVSATTESWLSLPHWRRNRREFTAGEMIGRPCYAALDMSEVSDLTSLALVFPGDRPADPVRLLNWYWLPDEDLVERERQDKVPLQAWREEGWLRTTPGETINQALLAADLISLLKQYRPQLIAYDDWNALAVAQALEAENFRMVKFIQSLRSFHAPSQEWERLILEGKLLHDGNPITTWCVGNVQVRRDESGKIRPVKEGKTSRRRIDGVVAGIMALDCELRRRAEQTIDYSKVTSKMRGLLGA